MTWEKTDNQPTNHFYEPPWMGWKAWGYIITMGHNSGDEKKNLIHE